MKAKSFKIREGLYVNELTVQLPAQPVVTKVESKHQYLIIDRSGSMWSQLDNIVDILIEYTGNLPEGSTVSVGYFSGPGEYALTVPYVLKKEQDAVTKVLNTYRPSMGLTDFIEVLDKIEVDSSGKKGSLFFFTDGCHNSGGSFQRVIDILSSLREYLEVSVFVGCGWIDRDNMQSMAEASGGSFIQLSDFSEFKQSLEDFGESVKESVPGFKVPVPAGANNICSILGRNIVQYSVDDSDSTIYYRASNKSKQAVFFTSSIPLTECQEVGSKDELPLRSIAYALVKTNQVPIALEVLNVLGEKYFIRKLFNTFTPDEYALIENELVKSIFDTRKRYKEGSVKNYLPDPNAFCVLDALNVLISDDTAKVHLNDPDFEYKSISPKSIQTDGSKMVYPDDIVASAKDIKYHSSRLNASLSVSYKAFVPLVPEDFKNTDAIKNEDKFKEFGLTRNEKYAVTCFRNYNIILDGKLNTKKLVLSDLSKDSISKLGSFLELRKDKKYVLDLSLLPLVNSSYADDTSARKLATDCWIHHCRSIEHSVAKYLLNEGDNSCTDQEDPKLMFLAENYYISRGSYQPPKTLAPVSDQYSAYEFKISFKGYASKPSVPSVVAKVQAGKSVTAREQITANYYSQLKSLSKSELSQVCEQTSAYLRESAALIQSKKMAIILIKRGCFDEFRDRSDMSVEIPKIYDDGMVTAEFTITKTDVKI